MKETSTKKQSLLEKWKQKNKGLEPKGIQKIPDGIPIPLSHEQQRLWFLQQLFPDNAFYNYSELYRLEGDLQVEPFKQSIRSIESNHDVLRSNFKVNDGNPVVQIAARPNSEFHYHDFSDLEDTIASQKADEIIHKNARHAFNLSDETLMQSTLIKVGDQNFLFLIVMHHIITDKWSMRVFRKELSANYTSLLQSKVPSVEKPEIQYASYAHWQGNKEINSEHLEYWKQKLSGEISTLNLPTDYPRKAQPSYAGTFHKKGYSDKISSEFFDVCKQLDATPYVVMLSVYYILLQKYSGQEDIFIGTPITKRDQVALENLIGFFNDTLVLRTKVNDNSSFTELVQSVKQTTLEAFSNTEITFDTLVKTLKPGRSLSINPFFQVMFLYHTVPETPTLGPDINITYEPYDSGVAKFDLTLYISNDKGALTSLMEYETDLFEESTIERMHEHFEILLKSVIQNPNALLSQINMQTEDEEHFYETLESPEKELGISYDGIHEIIEAQAQKFPDKIALVFKDKKVTYRQLDQEANKIASYLVQQGIQRNDIVGLCIERSERMIIGLLGILKAGASYLPLDPSYPLERISYILDNSLAKILLTEIALVTNFTEIAIKVSTLEAIQNKNIESDITLPKVEDTDLAYVIYTSGSTGVPKGVPITHKNITNSTLARTDFYKSDPATFLLMSSISFDSSKVGIFWSLCTGGTLVISEDKLEQNIEQLTNIMKLYSVSHTLMLPSLYANIVNYADLDKLRSLDTVIVAGEACTAQLVSDHFEKLPQVKLYNEYGPTESTVWCIAHQLEEKDSLATNIPIGHPVKNIQVYILDDHYKRAPYGTVGELYIGGVGLSSGYINDIEKTSKAFIDHPFDKSEGKKLYKTGDLAKFRNDGAIEFLGRKDQQVKIRGYRIELDEIEQIIYSNPTIQQAVVKVEDDTNNIDWDDLENKETKQLMQLFDKHIESSEVQNILKSIETLQEEELEVLLENLNDA